MAAAPAPATAEPYYAESGEHGQAGYYVKTVGCAPVAKPVSLSETEAAKHAILNRSGSGSAWNGAGTWEDKDVSAWAKVSFPEPHETSPIAACFGARGHLQRRCCWADDGTAARQDALRELLVGLSSSTVRISAVEMSGGRASCVMVRGQKRAGWDLTLELSWEAVADEDESGGGAAAAPTDAEMAEEADEGDEGADVKINDDGDSSEDDEDEDDEVAAPGRDRGTITVETNDLDDVDDIEFSEIKVTGGGLTSHLAGKELGSLRPLLYERLTGTFKQAILEAAS